jgi:hypothetical protein
MSCPVAPLSPMACMTHIERGTTRGQVTRGIGSIFLTGSWKMAEGCGYYFSRYLKEMKCIEYESISSTCAFLQRY